MDLFGILLGTIVALTVAGLVIGTRWPPSHPIRVAMVRAWWLAIFWFALGAASLAVLRSPAPGFVIALLATAWLAFDWWRTRGYQGRRWWDP